ncbi:TPA: hypothetical protein ACQNWS_001361 [Streptococcus pyogenes]|uniref:Uncharacterized protein n=2 Tax=Streptococcus pyogenes TaxID=1314 RepID=A0A5S4U0D4_STRPY|nr:hypothetical protein [Streptococcus pyogenes]NP_795434.1 hypothetical protein SpyM3_0973 [Streptococcus phage 315.2]ESU89948.1 hypothetical protein HMPREF1241_0856 [Streptococcus pyogenes GA03799]QBX19385.1 hypothetical protein Javan483_0053 [Streptococcus phage Javan483]QBX29677.1 hypothetical protein Javan508_0054 [Streptococcus phage Javan508]HEP6174349.1 hypothetical protein [Streptococcus pyogenes ABC020026425]HEP6177932.1 hypothetical protein [Streptococcus pyogenes ABC020015306]HEP
MRPKKYPYSQKNYPAKLHNIIETGNHFLIDDKRIHYVIEDSVKTKTLGDGYVEVTLFIIAKSFTKSQG